MRVHKTSIALATAITALAVTALESASAGGVVRGTTTTSGGRWPRVVPLDSQRFRNPNSFLNGRITTRESQRLRRASSRQEITGMGRGGTRSIAPRFQDQDDWFDELEEDDLDELRARSGRSRR
jgi:hypothetical protein